ncbi:MAG TPA: GlxA family transcriptional regulator [Microthrixaceae bacterium]|nr:GlxA family transcriptional regulator [Microthrixaceae bacterium]
MTQRITFVVYPDFQLLDLAGPVDAFRAAALLSEHANYEWSLLSPDGQPVRSSSLIEVGVDAALSDTSTASIDTLVVVGGFGVDAASATPGFPEAVREAADRARRITSVCTGALALAHAGLLDGHEVTTHWASCELLAKRHPDLTVHADRIFVRDRDRWTSAGVTAGIDLALALIEDDHGPALAHEVAAWLVVFARRPGGQAQFSAQLSAQRASRSSLRELQDWLPDHLDHDLTVAALAARTGMSDRNFARAFRAEVGTTPAAHVESLRIEASRRLLETTDLTVGAVARAVGLGHGETLHRAFRRRVGTTPDRYRQHFARTTA